MQWISSEQMRFYPRDARLCYARRYASVATSHDPVSVCLCLCLSVTSRCSIEMAERIELVFRMGASFHPSHIVLKKGNSGIFNNKGIFPSELCPKLRTRKFCFAMSIVETCCQLSSTTVDAQRRTPRVEESIRIVL